MSCKDFLIYLLYFDMALFIIFLFINMFIVDYLGTNYNFENIPIIDEVEQSLNSRIITHFHKSHICNQNEEELIIDQFGPIENCSCHRKMFANKCPNRKGCISLEIPAKNYTKFNSYKFCVIKSKKYSELLENNNIIPKNEECHKNYIYCGIIDSLERKLCLKKGEKCPLKISDIDHNEKGGNKDKILYKLKLDQNIPCIDPDQRNWNFFGELKGLNKICSHKIKNELFNYEFNKLNITTSQYELYKDNDILDNILKYKANKADLEKEKVFVFGRNFIAVDRSKVNFSKNNLIDMQGTLNRCIKTIKIVGWFLIIPFLFIGDCGGVMVIVFAIISAPVSIIFFIVSCIIYVYHCKVSSILDIKSDIGTNELIELTMKGTSKNYYLSLISIHLFLIILIIYLFIIIIKKFI